MRVNAWVGAGPGVLWALSGVLGADLQYGHERTLFAVGEHRAFVILPRAAATDAPRRPWAWYAPTFINGYPNPSNEWLFRRLLVDGWVVAGIDVGESYGSPAGRAAYTRFYQQVVPEYRLAAKSCLVAQSRGGLMLYNWAVENPEKVKCIAAIYAVCDLRSFPGLRQAAPAYGLDETSLAAHLSEHNPIDRLEPLAKAGVPIFHIHGDSDAVVPLDRNSQVLCDRYRALGGRAALVVVPGKGHAEVPEFFQSQTMLAFLLGNR
jgi:pimeloyl-ACP methyl ester carboxylesterase